MSHEGSDMPDKAQVAVAGLDTGPNDIAKPEGTFLWADNVVHRRNGILEPLEDPQPYPDVVQPAGRKVLSVFADWDAPFFAAIEEPLTEFGPVLRFSDEIGIRDSLDFGYVQHELVMRPAASRAVMSNGRMLISGMEVGPTLAADVRAPVIFAAPWVRSEVRPAGISPPVGLFVATNPHTNTTQDPPLQIGECVSYTVVLRRSAGFFQITSAPSIKMRTEVVSVASDVQVVASWHGSQDVKLNDEVIVFRTKPATSPDAINDTYYKVASMVLTATDLINGFAAIRDQLPPLDIAEELYTNSGIQGSLAANFHPPASKDVTTFKDTTWYLESSPNPVVSLTLNGFFNGIAGQALGGHSFAATVVGSVVTPSNVASMVNVGVGQRVDGVGFTPAARVVSTGPTSFTVNENLGASGTVSVSDIVRIEAVRGNTVVDSADILIGFGSFDTVLTQVRDNIFNVRLELDRPVEDHSQIENPTFLFSAMVPGFYTALRVTVPVAARWNIKANADGTGTAESASRRQQNLAWFSKTSEPEHVPPVNYLAIGSGECYRLVPTENSILAFCSDGIFRITGAGNQWSVSQISKTDVLMHPDAVDVFENVAWAWVEHGLAVVTEQSVEVISEDAIGPSLEAAVQGASFFSYLRQTWGTFVRVDRINHEVRFQCANALSGEVAFSYIFNVRTKMWTQVRAEDDAHKTWSGGYSRTRRAFIEGRSAAYTLQEPGFYRPSTIVYNVFTSPTAAYTKEWVDVNWFLDMLESTDGNPVTLHYMYGGAEVRGLETRALLDLERVRPSNSLTLEAADTRRAFAAHSLVPRRAGRSPELVIGLEMPGNCYYQMKGAAVQHRAASKVIKRQ